MESAWAEALPEEEQIVVDDLERHPTAGLPYAWVSEGSARALGGIEVGDLLYVSDRRAWLGGLRSGHVLVGEIRLGDQARVGLPPALHKAIVPSGRADVPLRLKRLY